MSKHLVNIVKAIHRGLKIFSFYFKKCHKCLIEDRFEIWKTFTIIIIKSKHHVKLNKISL